MPCHLGGSAAEGKHGQERKRDTSTLLGSFTSFQKRVVKSRIALALSREETRREGCVILTAGGRFESVVLTTAGQPGCQQRRPRIGAAPSKPGEPYRHLLVQRDSRGREYVVVHAVCLDPRC